MGLPLIVGFAVAVWSGEIWAGVAGALVAYALHCLAHPEADCAWCGGKPKRRDESGRVFHRCYVCGGSGVRDRVGTIAMGRSKARRKRRADARR